MDIYNYIHNINILVIKNRICRDNLAYNVALYRVAAYKMYTVC